MTHIGPLNALPIACTLGPNVGREQVERWRDFDGEYAVGIERTDTQLVVHYRKVEESVQRLRQLVATESDCCSFVDWAIDNTHDDLRLIVTGTPGQLAALHVG
ncbi:MAG: hypothetical protein GX610_13355 [Rhodococcus sp.]|nr:hypothetical protein [Rhodococcus sp. (in: high G+C Gram-positive bacteria)]